MNKSQAIRDHRAENPNAKTSEIVKAMKGKKIDVSPAFVSQILTQDRLKKSKANSVQVEPNSDIALLVEAENFSIKVGGIERADTALSLLKKFREG